MMNIGCPDFAALQSLQGRGGTGVPWNGQGTLTAGSAGLTYVNLSTSGQKYDDITHQPSLLPVNIGADCSSWLTTNLSGTTFDAYVANLSIGTFDSVITTSTHMYVNGVGASAGDAGYDILFSVSNYNPGGTLGSAFATFIHEIAHLLKAPGFQNADGATNPDGTLTMGAQVAQQNNANLIEQHCGSTINH
jgi:hypothetical protein